MKKKITNNTVWVQFFVPNRIVSRLEEGGDTLTAAGYTYAQLEDIDYDDSIILEIVSEVTKFKSGNLRVTLALDVNPKLDILVFDRETRRYCNEGPEDYLVYIIKRFFVWELDVGGRKTIVLNGDPFYFRLRENRYRSQYEQDCKDLEQIELANKKRERWLYDRNRA